MAKTKKDGDTQVTTLAASETAPTGTTTPTKPKKNG